MGIYWEIKVLRYEFENKKVGIEKCNIVSHLTNDILTDPINWQQKVNLKNSWGRCERRSDTILVIFEKG